MELRRTREARKTCLGDGVGNGRSMVQREGPTESSILRVFIWRSWGRIPIEYLSAF